MKNPSNSVGRMPWLLAWTAVLAGVILILMVGRLWNGAPGPLAMLSMTGPADVESAAVSAKELQKFVYNAVTRRGDRWQLTARVLRIDATGLSMDEPALELLRSGHPVVRLSATTGSIPLGEAALRLETKAHLVVGTDFEITTANLELTPQGTVLGRDAVQLRTPRGISMGTGISVDPVEGMVTLSPGQPTQRVYRWNGWGRDLADLGQAYGRWSRSTGGPHQAVRTAIDR